MEIEKKQKKTKARSLFRLFMGYLLRFLTAVILLLMVAVFTASFAMQWGVLLPANYTDEKLSQIEDSLRENFDREKLPAYCTYILLDADGQMVETTMNDREISRTRVNLTEGKKNYYEFFKEITLDNGDILIIKYDMLAHFSNPALHKLCPCPELVLPVIIFAVIVMMSIVTALRFSRELKRNLVPIETATKKIEERDLDFRINPTKITEFNSSLEAIDKLKEALTISLNEQWDTEQKRKSQISALAHDIKTPLTIIKGNAELLLEEECTGEDRELLSYIQTSSERIEQYLELLMGVVNHDSMDIHRESIPLKNFIDEVEAEILPLCRIGKIELETRNHLEEQAEISADKELLKRALVNVVDNAVRYSEENSDITLDISEEENSVQFKISDCGKGFSEESLKRATEEFYTEDTSRTNHNYGLGLNFARRIAELHGGTLTLGNRKEGEGAEVLIEISKTD